jgi:hypothetical protein
MTVSSDFFQLALLAKASYAKFDLYAPSKIKDALIAQGFSGVQADIFLDHWDVVSRGHCPNTSDGFSSTLFQNAHDPTKYVLSFRGTEPKTLDDWRTDIGDIAVDGIAIDQGVDLNNDWQRTSRGTCNAAHLETQWTATVHCRRTPAQQYAIDGLVEWTAEAAIVSLRSRTGPTLGKSVRAEGQAASDSVWRVAV